MFDLQQHREEFLGLKDKHYFNFGGQGILPKSAFGKMIDTYQYIDKVGPFGLKINTWVMENIQDTKKAIADEMKVTPETIALTENVTSSCNIALWGIKWEAGDEILLTDAEHPGVIAIIEEIARRFDVKISTCPIVATVNEGNPIQVIKNHLTPKTRLVVISHILWNTGQVLPLKEIVSTCHNNSAEKQTQVLVDGAQSAGCLPVDLIDSEVDYYGCTGHKWLCGPGGVGFLYVRSDLLSSFPATFIGWRGLNYSQPDMPLHEDARRYEVATSAYPLFSSLTEAIAIHQKWGTIEQRYQRICQLSEYLWIKLDQLPRIECVKNSPPQSGLVSFYPRTGIDAQKMVQNLENKGFYLRTLVYPYCIRACVHYLTTETEIDDLIQIIDQQ